MPDSDSQADQRAAAKRGGPKFSNPDITAGGAPRARVSLEGLKTLWVNTGTLCNITCANCYIESSPTNDRLAYFPLEDLMVYLDEIARDGLGTEEIGFTGGEPFMNPEMVAMLDQVLGRGLQALVLTNAMKPMEHKKAALLRLKDKYAGRLRIRVSVDHYSAVCHEEERGPDTWGPTIVGLKWLWDNGFAPDVAGRTLWGEDEADMRAGYGALFHEIGIGIDPNDRECLVLFPEMDGEGDVPEITEQCWGILGVDPADIMCASARMVVRRKGADRSAVLACTLIPYDERFELGTTLAEANGAVSLNHPHCARFCVLGGGSCSGE
jgi:hypothetical protein